MFRRRRQNNGRGMPMHWEGGRLSKSYLGPERVLLRLHPTPTQSSNAVWRQVNGDKGFSSGHPAMQTLNPAVYQMILVFPDAQ